MVQQSDDLTRQALSYLRYQGAKSLSALSALMERTAQECARCLEGVSEEQASFKPGEEWSIREVLGHLLVLGEASNRIIRALAAGEEPSVEVGDGAAAARRPFAELRQALADQWVETCRLAVSLPEEASLERTAPHPIFGPLNFKEWLVFQRLHAMDHVQQMEKVKAAPGYPEG